MTSKDGVADGRFGKPLEGKRSSATMTWIGDLHDHWSAQPTRSFAVTPGEFPFNLHQVRFHEKVTNC
jgi:hypothetical protein